MRARGARARCRRLPDSGHHLYLENPDDFNRCVLECLEDVVAAERA